MILQLQLHIRHRAKLRQERNRCRTKTQESQAPSGRHIRSRHRTERCVRFIHLISR